MKTVIGALLASVLLAAACAPAPEAAFPAPAAPSGASSVAARASWQQSWDETVAAAKKEGSVTIYSSNTPETRQMVGDAMRAKFGIRVEWATGGGSNELVQKILAERNARLYNVDAMLGGTMSIMNFLKPAGALLPLEQFFILPEVTDTSKWFQDKLWWVDKERTHLAYAAIAMPGIVVNSDVVRPEEMASYRDLLNPKWKGKILMDDPSTGGPGNSWVTAIGYNILDNSFLEELARQEPEFHTEKRTEHEWVARGKYPVLIGGSTDTIFQLKNSGVSNLAVIAPREGTWLSQSNGAITLLNNAPHPNAAKVLFNWILSAEGQTVVCRGQGLQSARIDVPTDWVDSFTIRQPGVKYADAINLESQVKKGEYAQLAKKIFNIKR
ncbi:MAG: extracellular solute-binding protein [Chloroflexi bacterium]|nr:extracellular solute-binding protein [Chloroflexota bacterium]